MNAWENLKNAAICDFIRHHEGDDVAALALKKPPSPDWPWPLVLDQIKARQKAQTKIPSWHATNGIIFPPPGLVEQASSQGAARYKASLVAGESFADLTAGAGVDFAAFLKNFRRGTAIEKDADAAGLLAHNLKILNPGNFEIQNGDAEELIANLPPQDFIYIDPQRRSGTGKGRFLFEDCAPDVLKILPMLRGLAPVIMIKASPMLDIGQAIKSLETVHEVHVVEWRGECREVLYILKRESAADVLINAVTINDEGAAIKKFSFARDEEKNAGSETGEPEKYLFEPSPALQKSGGFKILSRRFGVKKLHPHTHLYTAAENRPDFPGRAFEIVGVYPASGKNLSLTKANLSIRNFHGSVEDLRKKLKIADGGEDYLFACTLASDRKVLIHARKR